MDSKKCDVTWINIFFTSSRVNLKPEPNELVEAVAMIGKHHVKQVVVYRIQLQTDVLGGSEVQPFKIRKHLKSALFEDWISKGLDCEWSKRGLFSNGLDFEWDLNSGSLTICNPDFICFQYSGVRESEIHCTVGIRVPDIPITEPFKLQTLTNLLFRSQYMKEKVCRCLRWYFRWL